MRLIDADALMDDICGAINEMTSIGIMVDGEWLWAKLNDAIENAQTIEPERKTGKWEQIEISYLEDLDSDTRVVSMLCPRCKTYHNKLYLYGNPVSGVNFCPNCGADLSQNNREEKHDRGTD